jgi:Protein of Unknown function (DUF2784)
MFGTSRACSRAWPKTSQRKSQRITDSLSPANGGNCPILAVSALAEAVLFLHLLWCAWVLLGWTVTRCRRLLRTLHISSFICAIVIELVPWPPCPLTVAETWLEARAGIEPTHGPFLVHVLDAVVYPDLPQWLVVNRDLALFGESRLQKSRPPGKTLAALFQGIALRNYLMQRLVERALEN